MRIGDCGLRIVRWRSVAVLLSLVACASPPPPTVDPAPVSAGIRPGDVINIKVWREPDYSGQAIVDARGRVVLPVLGEIAVGGASTEALGDSLKTVLRRYLNNPSIEVQVQRRVFVDGEVVRPGPVLADATISVGEVISLAGGISPLGNRNKVMLLRDNRILVAAMGPGTVLQRSAVQSGDHIFVPQRSWMSRNGQIFVYGAISITSSIIVALVVRR